MLQQHLSMLATLFLYNSSAHHPFFYLNKTTESQREPAINGNEKCRIGISKWHQNCKLATANQLSLALSLASLAVWQHLSQISRINTVPVPVPVPVPENWSSRH